MNENRAKSIVKNYFKKIRLLQIFSVCLTCSAIAFLQVSIRIKVIIVLILILSFGAIAHFVDKNIDKILFDECNPELYYLVKKGINPKKKDIVNDIYVSYFIGDFATSYKLSNETYIKMKPIAKPLYIKFMCSSLFLSGNFDECKETIKEFDTLLSSLKLKEKIKENLIINCRFYEYFIDGEYDNAKATLDKMVSAPRRRNTYVALTDYYYAINEYYYGDIDKATELFEKISTCYPDMTFIAGKSKEYLTAIERGFTLAIKKSDMK